MNRFLDAIEDRWPLILRLVGVAIVVVELAVDDLHHPEMILAALPLLGAPAYAQPFKSHRRRRRREEDDD